jgi:hypothetical protein
MQTWTTQNAGEVICEGCGAVYAVSITRLPCRDSDYFNCELCGHEINRWNDTKVPSYTLIRGKS